MSQSAAADVALNRKVQGGDFASHQAFHRTELLNSFVKKEAIGLLSAQGLLGWQTLQEHQA